MRGPGVERFTAAIYQGHSDCAVLVPFDPAKTWKTKPRRIGYGKHMGHAVLGTVDGQPFESWIWFYFREWRMVIADSVLEVIEVAPGDPVKLCVRPHPDPDSVPLYAPGPKRS